MPCRHAQSCSRIRGFTLVEIVIVIGLLCMVTGLVVSNLENLLPAFQSTPLEVQFRKAVREARIKAATSNHPVYLRFDDVAEEFQVVDRAPASEEDMDAPVITNPEVTVEFFPVPAEAEGGLGRTSDVDWDEPLPQLQFHPSGVSQPAQVRFRWRTGEESVLSLDPFSSGPLASKELFE
ncbi:prepilin-type N-terminal cleavage/methylation domain-containing protein [Ruficoccus sp. ZRK36]|uniref:prepilin-type N-terminal cleavage/methylation domain-containing protein n=1 Tax=Ruficoccus sp. ZRK36 TaxID=2866311 RepID=UPI001C73066C|nr:prepilin-type N-terminal cleavage/methylation domain-containing protein [Ruficoccus sp. ZRK36]QYY34368.1 prepilin-type N-terminal cleavage/methylation domain-containing protein [Ruficoccus sp. ZRK36]